LILKCFVKQAQFLLESINTLLTMGVRMLRYIALAVLLGAAATSAHANLITVSASGANAVDIQPTVDSFRAALGTLNANVAGSFGTVHGPKIAQVQCLHLDEGLRETEHRLPVRLVPGTISRIGSGIPGKEPQSGVELAPLQEATTPRREGEISTAVLIIRQNRCIPDHS
jgi:hypothetical protein